MRREIRITVAGLAPLVLKRSFQDSVTGVSAAPKLSQRELSLEEEIYRDKEGRLALPSFLMLDVLNYKAARIGLLPRGSGVKDFTTKEKWILLLDSATGCEAEVQPHIQQDKDFTAAQIDRWCASFTLEYESTQATSLVRQAVNEAGQMGVGCGGRNLFGRFEVTDWEEVN